MATGRTCFHIPQLDSTVIGRSYDKLVIELQARHRRLVLVSSWITNQNDTLEWIRLPSRVEPQAWMVIPELGIKYGWLPERVWRHLPLMMSQTLTVESALPDTRMLLRSSMPDVRDWWPMSVCLHAPVSASHTRMLVSKDPLTTWTPSNCKQTSNTSKTRDQFIVN